MLLLIGLTFFQPDCFCLASDVQEEPTKTEQISRLPQSWSSSLESNSFRSAQLDRRDNLCGTGVM